MSSSAAVRLRFNKPGLVSSDLKTGALPVVGGGGGGLGNLISGSWGANKTICGLGNRGLCKTFKIKSNQISLLVLKSRNRIVTNNMQTYIILN